MVATGQEFEVVRTVLGISVLVLAARLFAAIAARFRVPEVIGEITAGIVLGPYALGSFIQFLGAPLIDLNALFLSFALIGSMIVLLTIGLSFKPVDMLKSGGAGFVVAVCGVVVPFFLGYYAMLVMNFSSTIALVIGASLTATSIAITYAVLRELRKHHTKEARIIISAAVIDDILGIVVLSIVLSLHGTAAPTASGIASQFIFLMLGWAAITAVAVALAPKAIRLISRSSSSGMIEAGVTVLTFGFSIAALLLGLSPIVGAFAVGMALTQSEFYQRIHSFVSDLMMIFGPLFFAVIGTYLNPAAFSFASLPLILLLLALAIFSKYVGCGLPALYFLNDVQKASKVGIGMSSRGEIAFIILGIALTDGIIPTGLYSIALFALLATSIVSSLLLQRVYRE